MWLSNTHHLLWIQCKQSMVKTVVLPWSWIWIIFHRFENIVCFFVKYFVTSFLLQLGVHNLDCSHVAVSFFKTPSPSSLPSLFHHNTNCLICSSQRALFHTHSVCKRNCIFLWHFCEYNFELGTFWLHNKCWHHQLLT